MRRRKPKTIPLSERSERTKRRVAMALAWDKLDCSVQNDFLRIAGRVLGHLREIV